MTNENIETQLARLVAAERLFIPVSSIDNKLKKRRPVMAKAIALPDGGYQGERFYARVETEEVTAKARTMAQAVDQFAEQYPRHGDILKGLIAETRQARETNMYFGMTAGSRLTSEDYLGVMKDLGFTATQANALYGPLMDASRNISRARSDGERSILIG